MVSYLADENFNNHVLRSLHQRHQDIDVVRVQDVGLSGALDEIVLDWALQHKRILLTHDVKTIPPLVINLFQQGHSVPGIFIAQQTLPISSVVDDLILVALTSDYADWEGKMYYLPL